ncbi:MAG: TIGR02147 family protein [Pseudobdellovibrionaceae bacterium]
MSQVFNYKEYKVYLRHRVYEKHGGLTKVSKAAGCQPAYLSKVLSESTHITPDQAFRISRSWGLIGDSQEYWLALVEFERSGDLEHRKYLNKKLLDLREKNLELKNVTARKPSEDALNQLTYHSHWAIMAIHILCSCPSFNDFNKIRNRLGLPDEIIKSFIRILMELGLVYKNKDQSFMSTPNLIHIDRHSPVLPIFLNNWRQRAMVNAPILTENSIHYSNVQSISEKDYNELLSMTREFIRSCTKKANESGYENVFAMNIDLFKP